MAGEEDTELRDLVAQSLEAKGVLGKIRVSYMRVRVVLLEVSGIINILPYLSHGNRVCRHN